MRVARAQEAGERHQGAAAESARLGQVTAARRQQHRQVVGRHRHLGVAAAVDGLVDSQRAAQQPLGLGEPPLRLAEHAEAAQVDRHLAAAGAALAAEDPQRALVEARRLVELPLTVEQRRQRGHVRRHRRVRRPEDRLAQRHRPARGRLAARMPPARVLEPTQVVIEGRRRQPAALRAA